MIIGIYLFLPIINKWVQKASKKEILFYLLVWIGVLMIDLPVINRLFTRIDWRYFSGFLGYVILGFYLNKYVNIQKNKWFYAVLFLLGNLITFIFTCFLSYRDGAPNKTFFSYLTPNVIMSAIGIFIFFKDKTIKNPTVAKIIESISQYSFGIYLSHVFAMIILPKIEISFNTEFVLVNIFATAILTLISSYFITLIINKLPLGKHISG